LRGICTIIGIVLLGGFLPATGAAAIAADNAATTLEEELSGAGPAPTPEPPAVPQEFFPGPIPVPTPESVSEEDANRSIPSESETAVEAPAAELEAQDVTQTNPTENSGLVPLSKKGFSLGALFSSLIPGGSAGDPNSKDKFALTFSLRGGYDDNVFASAFDPIASPFANLNGNLSYFFGSKRLQLNTQLGGGVTYYQNRPGRKQDYNGTVDLSARFHATRRLEFFGAVRGTYLAQPDPTVVGGAVQYSGDYIVANATGEVSYDLMPKLATRAKYTLNGIRYTDDAINQGQGFVEQTFSLGADFLLRPTTTLTMEFRYNPISYYEAGLGSDGYIATFGFVQSFTPRFSWMLQGGGEYRILKNPADVGTNNYFGPFVESRLSYSFAPASSLLGSLRYGTEPSGVSGVTIRQTLRGSLSVEHRFSAYWSMNLGLTYENSYYDQPGVIPDYSANVYSGFLGVRFQLNPAFALTADYSYTNVLYEGVVGNYSRNIVSTGLQIIF